MRNHLCCHQYNPVTLGSADTQELVVNIRELLVNAWELIVNIWELVVNAWELVVQVAQQMEAAPDEAVSSATRMRHFLAEAIETSRVRRCA